MKEELQKLVAKLTPDELMELYAYMVKLAEEWNLRKEEGAKNE